MHESVLVLSLVGLVAAAAVSDGRLPTPSPQQLAWQEDEMSMFIHFTVNTFTDLEWGHGTEDPAIFDPTELDTRQWVRVAKETGFKLIVLTAKHHDGFCLWPSKYTNHSVAASPWRGGKGDVVRELAEACRAEGVKLGLYLSPWDRHEPTYGDSPRYNEHFENQLRELLTQYGPIAEVWFDGACGEGPNGKRQEYDWPGFYAVVRECQPTALIAICGPDIRWVGNESGVARETEWSARNPSPAEEPGAVGTVWSPAECDVSIRPGWFYHAGEDQGVRSVDSLMDIYFKSVGRNSELLLNVPPDRRGLLHEADVARLREFKEARSRTFGRDLATGKPATADSVAGGSSGGNAVDGDSSTCWTAATAHGPARLEVDLGRPTTFNIAEAEELIADGQRVVEYVLDGWDGSAWHEVVRGTTIGHKKLDRFAPVTYSKVRLTILKSLAPVRIRAFGLYSGPEWPVL